MSVSISTIEKETRRRDRIAISRRQRVVGKVALKQLVLRPSGMFADALKAHITRAPLSPSDRELFHFDPTEAEPAETASMPERHPNSDCSRHSAPDRTEPSLSWPCAFCPKIRIWEGGRPDKFCHLDSCAACGYRVADTSDDK